MTAVIQLKPEGRFSNKDLEVLVTELREVVRQKEVMHAKEAAEFLGISTSKLYRIVDRLPSHRLPGLGGKLFLRAELIEFIKKH